VLLGDEGGWGVVVLVAGMIALAFLAGLLCFGLLFAKYPYKDFTLRPGPWWRSYAADYSKHFGVPIDEVIKYSAIVEGTNGEIWATSTEDWDRDWFNKRGYAFPKRWIRYEILHGYRGVPGETVKLDI
jgi:hypothetical protein